MALARGREACLAGRVGMALVITIVARGIKGQPVIVVRRGHSGLMLVGLAVASRERAGGEVQCEEGE